MKRIYDRMIENPKIEFKTIDAHTIEVEVKEITDDNIYKLEDIKKRLDTYDIQEMSWFEYDYEPYYSWGERQTVTPYQRKYENYTDLLNHLIEQSQSDRRKGWSNRINFLNITLKLQDKSLIEKSDLDKKLNFIVNMLFDVYCHRDVHYEELLAKKLAKAESLGFNVEPSKSWDYDKSSYEYWKKELRLE